MQLVGLFIAAFQEQARLLSDKPKYCRGSNANVYHKLHDVGMQIDYEAAPKSSSEGAGDADAPHVASLASDSWPEDGVAQRV